MDIPRVNLIQALVTAIEARERQEREEWGYKLESAGLAGWRAMLAALMRGEQLSCYGAAYD